MPEEGNQEGGNPNNLSPGQESARIVPMKEAPDFRELARKLSGIKKNPDKDEFQKADEVKEELKELPFKDQVRVLLTRVPEGNEATITHEEMIQIARQSVLPGKIDSVKELSSLLDQGNKILGNPKLEIQYIKEGMFLSSSIAGRTTELEAKKVASETQPPPQVSQQSPETESEEKPGKQRERKEEKEKEWLKTEQGQLEYVRGILGRIERANAHSRDISISKEVTDLRNLKDVLKPEVWKEVSVRLALNESAELIRQASGFIEQIMKAASTADGRNSALSREVIIVLLKDGLPGLRIREAWNFLQEVNFSYPKTIEKVNERYVEEFPLDEKRNPILFKTNELVLRDEQKGEGYVPKNFFSDDNEERTSYVRKYILNEISQMLYTRTPKEVDLRFEVDDESLKLRAEESLRIAEKLTLATLENSVFNRTANAGNDELAEIIGLRGWRMGKAKNGDLRGPEVHMGLIDGFGTSWLRFLLAKDGPDKPFLIKDGPDEQFLIFNPKDLTTKEKVIYVSGEELEEVISNWVYYCTTIVNKRWNTAREILVERAPLPDKVMTVENIGNTVKKAFDTADPNELDKSENESVGKMMTKIKGKSDEEALKSRINEHVEQYLKTKKGGPKNLRLYWVLGLVDVTLKNRRSGWTGADYGRLEELLTKTPLGDTGTFLSPDQWKWVETQVSSRFGFNWELFKKTAFSPEAVEAFVKGAMGIKR